RSDTIRGMSEKRRECCLEGIDAIGIPPRLERGLAASPAFRREGIALCGQRLGEAYRGNNEGEGLLDLLLAGRRVTASRVKEGSQPLERPMQPSARALLPPSRCLKQLIRAGRRGLGEHEIGLCRIEGGTRVIAWRLTSLPAGL